MNFSVAGHKFHSRGFNGFYCQFLLERKIEILSWNIDTLTVDITVTFRKTHRHAALRIDRIFNNVGLPTISYIT